MEVLKNGNIKITVRVQGYVPPGPGKGQGSFIIDTMEKFMVAVGTGPYAYRLVARGGRYITTTVPASFFERMEKFRLFHGRSRTAVVNEALNWAQTGGEK